MRGLPGKRVVLRPLAVADARALRTIHGTRTHRITLDPAADKEAAIRCYRKAGFRRVGVMEAAWRDFSSGRWRDALSWSSS